MANPTDDIETGVNTDSEEIRTMDHDAEAWADDGEHATVWHFTRVSDELIEKVTFRAEAGLRDQDGHADVFDVEPDKPIREFAREVAENDPEEAVRLAREYWSEK